MTVLRKHQQEALVIASRYVSREWSFDGRKFVTAYVTPGGGKTGMSHGYANALAAAGLIDRVVIVAPRRSLVTQTIDAWQTGRFGQPRRLVNVTGASLAEGYYASEFGAATTYQAIAKDGAAANYRDLVSGARTLLILDEPHHLSAGGFGNEAAWLDAVAPMASAAKHVLLMSGTMSRHDGQRIPFATYDGNGSIVTDIAYTRRQALDEHAVLPIEVTRIPADVVYGKGDREFSVSLSDASATEAAPALRTALEMASYRDEKILDFLREHALYQQTRPGSAAIVVVHKQKIARHVAALARRVLNIDVALAISDDDGAHGAIAAFRKGYGPKVLVTVGMAYEGLDAPHATHMALFTATRSEQWNVQAIARITRFNPDFGSWESQRAYLTAPDDPPMRAILGNLLAEERPAHVPEIGPIGPPVERAEDRKAAEAVTAIDAAPLAERYSDDEGEIPDPERIKWLRWHSPDHHRCGARETLDLANAMGHLGFVPGLTGNTVVVKMNDGTRKIVDPYQWGGGQKGRLATVFRNALQVARMMLSERESWRPAAGEIAESAAEYRDRLLAIGVPESDVATVNSEVAA